jgi:hypothetical protein
MIQWNLFQWKQEVKEIGESFYLGVNISKSWLGGGGGKQIFYLKKINKYSNKDIWDIRLLVAFCQLMLSSLSGEAPPLCWIESQNI